jgi:hypothetical protein
VGDGLVPGKRTILVWEGVEFKLPEGHSATWVGEADVPELPERYRTEEDDRSIVLLSDGVVGGAYTVGDIDEDDEKVRVLLTGMLVEIGHASAGVSSEPRGYPFPGAE